MKVLDAAHTYVVSGEQTIQFIKRVEGQLVATGTTNEELIEVLIDRTKALNKAIPCTENDIALLGLEIALKALNQRTKARVAQNVESTDKPHV